MTDGGERPNTIFKMNNKLLYFIDDNSKQEKVLTAINLQSIVNS